MLAKIAAEVRPTAFVIGFDDPVHSLRRDRHPAYKAARPPKPAELVELLDELPELLRALGLCVVVPDGLEADDVLGSAAASRCRRAGCAPATAWGPSSTRRSRRCAGTPATACRASAASAVTAARL